MNADLIIIYGVFVYVLLTGMMLFWIRRDVINKLKLFFLAPKGAKLFTLYRKDGTRDEFVKCAKTGGVVEKDGDKYAIVRSTSFLDRGKNGPTITLAEGNLNSIDPFGQTNSRVDTKQLRALYFAEREKAKTDLNPDVKLLKLLVILSVLACGAALILSFLTYQNVDQITALLGTAQPAIDAAAQVVQL